MSAQFFNKPIGYATNTATVVRTDGAVVFIALADKSSSATPEQAKALGRALIKAGKFAEKRNPDHVPTDPRLSHDN